MFDTRVEDRLRGWARWMVSIENGTEGYPKKSILAVFADGLELREEFKSIPLITNDAAQEISGWINRMGIDYPDYREAVYLFYLTKKGAVQIASALCISKRTFYDRLSAAKTYLGGCLAANEKIYY